ncbi:MAG TPA: proline hydroxylase, partial [Rhodanobacter sp.]
MNAQLKTSPAWAEEAGRRLQRFDWTSVTGELDVRGSAMLEGLLSPAECAVLAGQYAQHDIFRSRVVMGRHGFGRGEYKYFSYPL